MIVKIQTNNKKKKINKKLFLLIKNNNLTWNIDFVNKLSFFQKVWKASKLRKRHWFDRIII